MTKYLDISDCRLQYKPSAAKLQLHVIAVFIVGVSMSSWTWTGSALDIWIRFFKK